MISTSFTKMHTINSFTVQDLNVINVQNLSNMTENPDQFNVLRKIKSNPNSSQRKLASELGFSLGKLNYCLKALNKKGLIKIKNFRNNSNKLGYAYIITPSGVAAKARLTLNFMQRKMKEYDELKSEYEGKS